MVFKKKGVSESLKKSLKHVLVKLATATMLHSCHVSMVMVIILVFGDGPRCMKSEWNRPIELNEINTMTSQTIRHEMAIRLSSKTASRMHNMIGN